MEARVLDTPVGDVTSDERGSGARANSGKMPADLVPLRFWARAVQDAHLKSLLHRLAEFQTTGDSKYLRDLFEGFIGVDDLAQAARVFDFGREKYAAWNWAKGMQWSVPVGCIIRHALAIDKGELDDPESGLSHWGHIVCNLIMLDTFVSTYPEGNDIIGGPMSLVWHQKKREGNEISKEPESDAG